MKFYACPPAWNVTPADYSKWRRAVEMAGYKTGTHKDGYYPESKKLAPRAPIALTATTLAGWGTLWGAFATLVATNTHPSQFLLLFPMAGLHAWSVVPLQKKQRAAKAAYELATLPADHAAHVLPLSQKIAEGLSFDLTHGHFKGTREDALEKAWEAAKLEKVAADRKAAEDALKREADAKARQVAKEVASKDKRISELEKALANKIVLDNPLPPVDPTLDSDELLKIAITRHEKIREAWTAVITDPLNALDHASLFDVSDTRTAAFISAYGALEDLRAIHPSGIPHRLVDSYSEQTRECERLWEDAYAYSSKRGFDFLPAGERDLARKASRLLALAADEASPISERAAAATKAAEMLARINTVTLPEPSRAQIEALTRLQLSA